MRKAVAAVRTATSARSSAVRPAVRSAAAKKAAASRRPAPVRQLQAVKPVPPPVVEQPYNPFRNLLLMRRQELTGNLEDTKFDTLARMGRVAEDDQAQMSHEEFISLQRNSMDYQALRQVNAALERLNTGEFGICASCEEPISEKRLKAIPWAKYCVTCQDRVHTQGPQAEELDEAEVW